MTCCCKQDGEKSTDVVSEPVLDEYTVIVQYSADHEKFVELDVTASGFTQSAEAYAFFVKANGLTTYVARFASDKVIGIVKNDNYLVDGVELLW